MKCINCGNEMTDDSLFCMSCGAKQPEQPVQPAAPVYEQPVQDVYQPVYPGYVQPPVGQPTAPAEPPKKNKTGMIIGIVAAVLAVVLAVVLCIVFFGDKDDKNKDNSGNDEETTTVAEEDETKEDGATKEEEPTEEETTEAASVNPEYLAVLDKYGIEHLSDSGVTPADTNLASFVWDYATTGTLNPDIFNYAVEVNDLIYTGDVVKSQKITCYFGLKEEYLENEEIVNSLIDEYDKMATENIVVSTDVLSDCVVVVINFEDTTNLQTLKDMYNVGVIDVNNAIMMSYSITEESLINAGYIKK